MKKPKPKTINVALDPDVHNKLMHMKADGRIKSISSLLNSLAKKFVERKDGGK